MMASKLTKDIFRKWEPLEGVRQPIYCEGLHVDWEGFRILLRPEDLRKGMLRVSFGVRGYVAFRDMDEGDRLRTLSSFPKELFGGVFFIVENSTWLDWFLEENHGKYKGNEFTHYAILTASDCIDVLARMEPNVEWL